MEKTGIPLIDKVLEKFPWYNSKEYIKMEERYGSEIKDILTELILMPILKFDTVNDMAEAIGRDKNKYYDLLKDEKINWLMMMQEISFSLLVAFLKLYGRKQTKHAKSRWRIRLLLDDTLIRRWGKKMAYAFNVYNSTARCFMHAQKVAFLAVSIGKDKFTFPLIYAFIDSKYSFDHRQPTELVIDILHTLTLYAKANDVNFDNMRFVADAGYTCKEIVQFVRSMGIEFYGNLKGSWNISLPDATLIKVRDLKNGHIPSILRQNYKVGEYYRLYANHPILGDIVLCIKPYFDRFTDRIKYLVFFSTNPNITCDVIDQEHSIRWIIEQMFRHFKHPLTIQFYHGRSSVGQHASYVITCLRFLFIQIAFKLSSRFPSLRWNIPNSKFGFSTFTRYIRDHYYLKPSKLNRLHFVLVSSS